jgi:hypothetical protein
VVPAEARLLERLSGEELLEYAGRRAPEVVADVIVTFLAAARITDIPITQPPVT